MKYLECHTVRPRQARYQAALRPDMKCTHNSKALFRFAPIHTSRVLLRIEPLCGDPWARDGRQGSVQAIFELTLEVVRS